VPPNAANPQSPATPADLFARFDALGIAHETVHHPPVHTVAEAKALRGEILGAHCKCLFLKDKKGALFLAAVLEHRRVDLKALSKELGAGRFSFGSADLLWDRLGVKPGSVTPFSLINDGETAVQPVFDQQMLAQSPLNYHPLENDKTTAIAPNDLLRFTRACGHAPRILDFDGLDLNLRGEGD
jgi:Ala-tRNA(Pro) deacylase